MFAAANVAAIWSPLFEPDAAQLHVLSYEPRVRKLHRQDKAQEFLDRQVGSAPVLGQPVTQSRVLYEFENRSADVR
jgi:hypothetical protein